MDWNGCRVLVTGGASFIGSHLAEALIEKGARVRVADNLSSGLRENLEEPLRSKTVDLAVVDLLDPRAVDEVMKDIQVVFHLAADHGGRGYIDLHQVNCSTNLILDGQVYRSAARMGVEKVVFASSACVYPAHLMTNPEEVLYLTEDLVGPPYDSDNLYGWAKMMGELALRAYCREGKLKGAVLRYFPVYGPRCPESHAVMAWIARAFVNESPFLVWGTGQQIRNWTYVTDIVDGTILAAERIDDGQAFNLGTTDRIKVVEAVQRVLEFTGKDVPLVFDPSKPTGPYNRTCSNTLAAELLGWKPQVSFDEGLRRSIDWYFETHDARQVARQLSYNLTERTHVPA